MSYFSDTFNPFLHDLISSIISPEVINRRLRCHGATFTSTDLLHSVMELLAEEVRRMELRQGVYDINILRALDVLAALQAELNLHAEAAATYLKIVTFDDVQEYMSLTSLNTRFLRQYQVLQPCHPRQRNLKALFNLSLNLNKSQQYIEAEVALRRLIPYIRSRYGRDTFQYRNAIEQLIFALLGQGCEAGAGELWVEYHRSYAIEVDALQSLEVSSSTYEENYETNDRDTDEMITDIDTSTDTEFDTDSEIDLETDPSPDPDIEGGTDSEPELSNASTPRTEDICPSPEVVDDLGHFNIQPASATLAKGGILCHTAQHDGPYRDPTHLDSGSVAFEPHC